MLGVDPMIAYHKLAIKKNFLPVKQKRRRFNQEKYDAISVEVKKLL